MMNADNLERLMYQIIGSISALDAPIVFKGALITKLVLAENHFNTIIRKTVDIDANWIGEPPAVDYLVELVNKALADVADNLHGKLTRAYDQKEISGYCNC